MKAVIQRVSSASVDVDGECIGSIGRGLLVFIAAVRGDEEAHADRLARKIAHLRIFEDAPGKMNCSVTDVAGAVIVISQFTLAADCRKGHRPSFALAEESPQACRLYERVCDQLIGLGLRVERGRFGAMMKVHLVNDGPVTIWLDFPTA